MGDRHPGLKRDPARDLRVRDVEPMPIVDKTKPFLAMNETTVCTVELTDRSGAKRGAVAIGFSRHDLAHGYVTYSAIDEAEAIVALIRNAIDDAKRIEAGEPCLAVPGIAPQRKH